MTDISKQHEEAIEALREVLQTKHPYLLDILAEVAKTPNGMVSLQLRVYNGDVTDAVFTDVIKKIYKPPTKT